MHHGHTLACSSIDSRRTNGLQAAFNRYGCCSAINASPRDADSPNTVQHIPKCQSEVQAVSTLPEHTSSSCGRIHSRGWGFAARCINHQHQTVFEHLSVSIILIHFEHGTQILVNLSRTRCISLRVAAGGTKPQLQCGKHHHHTYAPAACRHTVL